MVPLSLWLPSIAYRRNHLVHHNNERLTDPLDDPESYYSDPESWSHLSAAAAPICSCSRRSPGAS